MNMSGILARRNTEGGRQEEHPALNTICLRQSMPVTITVVVTYWQTPATREGQGGERWEKVWYISS